MTDDPKPGPTLAVNNVPTPFIDAITHEINFYSRLHKGERPTRWKIDPSAVEKLAAEIFSSACYGPAKERGLRLETMVEFVRAGGARIRGVQLIVKEPDAPQPS